MRTLSLIAITVFILLVSTASAAHPVPFKIRVDITARKITLTPMEGCTWGPTSFSKEKGDWPQLIVTSDEAYASWTRNTQPTGTFRFVLMPEDKGAKLTSICGTAWSSTSFSGSTRPEAPVSWHVDTTGVCLADFEKRY